MRDNLRYMGGCAKVICRYDIILYKGLEHGFWYLEEAGPGTKGHWWGEWSANTEG